jgi:hypothetical protein
VVAFNPSSREAQSFLSLVIAVGLYLETAWSSTCRRCRPHLNFENLPRVDDPAIDGVAAKLIAALNLGAMTGPRATLAAAAVGDRHASNSSTIRP